jgi:hypothetical protein
MPPAIEHGYVIHKAVSGHRLVKRIRVETSMGGSTCHDLRYVDGFRGVPILESPHDLDPRQTVGWIEIRGSVPGIAHSWTYASGLGMMKA